MKKKIVFFALIIIAILSYNYVYKKHRNIKTEKPEFTTTSTEISNEFSINPIKSEKKYLNITIEVSGEISEKTNTTVTLDNIVFCQFSNEINDSLKDNTQIKIKGRFIGYDDLLGEIKLDQCIIN